MAKRNKDIEKEEEKRQERKLGVIRAVAYLLVGMFKKFNEASKENVEAARKYLTEFVTQSFGERAGAAVVKWFGAITKLEELYEQDRSTLREIKIAERLRKVIKRDLLKKNLAAKCWEDPQLQKAEKVLSDMWAERNKGFAARHELQEQAEKAFVEFGDAIGATLPDGVKGNILTLVGLLSVVQPNMQGISKFVSPTLEVDEDEDEDEDEEEAAGCGLAAPAPVDPT